MKIIHLQCESRSNPIGLDTERPRFSWQFETKKRGFIQKAYQIEVSEHDSFFQSILWDSGRIESEDSVYVGYEGPSLKPKTRYYYRITAWDMDEDTATSGKEAFFETGLMACPWEAEWIVPQTLLDTSISQPAPMFRKEFNARKEIKSAKIYATALGIYELSINGKRVGEDYFAPGWTSYHKRLQYQAYDVTSYIKDGCNAIGAILGDGWYRGYLGWDVKRNTYGENIALLLQLHIFYKDGIEEIITSDGSWKSSTGPILASDIYNGEIYDARLELPGWDNADFDENGWDGVKILTHDKKVILAQEGPPVEKIEEIIPVNLITTPKGETVINMGQNMVGWIRFKVKGKRGDKVIIQHAEVLDKDGNFYTENLRNAKQIIKYTLKGESEEIYEPHFTFQGFQYIKLVEFPGTVHLNQFCGVVVHSLMEQTGHFSCSNEMVNQLQHNILWGQKGNFLDIPTDCPQRDERLGWTGDAQVYIGTACFNMDVSSFFIKWLNDMSADQAKNGAVHGIVPNLFEPSNKELSTKEHHPSAAWADAITICTWAIYQCYGDKKILEDQYESMKAYIEYVKGQGLNPFLWNTGNHLGDWLSLDTYNNSCFGATPRDFIATAFYAHSTSILMKSAEILNKVEDALNYKTLHTNIVLEFRKEFVTPRGRLAANTQTAHALALVFGLLEPEHIQPVADTLAKYIQDNDNHLNTGFVGTPHLCHALSANGHTDTAYKLLLQTTFPSWLYPITKGATTMWEHWNGIHEDGSFKDGNMLSFNHYAFGSVGDWMYRVLAGINTDETKPGYKHIIIKPQPEEGITYTQASFDCRYGNIFAKWTKTDLNFNLSIRIPPNTTATVVLPFKKMDKITVNNIKIIDLDYVYSVKCRNNCVHLEVGSGDYEFNYPLSAL